MAMEEMTKDQLRREQRARQDKTVLAHERTMAEEALREERLEAKVRKALREVQDRETLAHMAEAREGLRRAWEEEQARITAHREEVDRNRIRREEALVKFCGDLREKRAGVQAERSTWEEKREQENIRREETESAWRLRMQNLIPRTGVVTKAEAEAILMKEDTERTTGGPCADAGEWGREWVAGERAARARGRFWRSGERAV